MSTTSPSPVQPGDVIVGRYRVDQVLGMGAMGIVVAAVHLGLEQRVALKFMLATKGPQDELHARFLREARACTKLKTQHVCKVIDVGAMENGAPYMAMEYLDGCDLDAMVRRRGPLPVGEAAGYVLQACEAVAEAHAAGIVHRDLKPSNLFLTTGPGNAPCIKVLDFGISKFSEDSLKLTQAQAALGSPLYMSPEAMKSSRDVDGRTDLWALGVVLYELTTGKNPFSADKMNELCTKIWFEAPTPLSTHLPDAPDGFEAVILRCLEKERDKRFADVAQLAAALAPFAVAREATYVERVATALGPQASSRQAAAALARSGGATGSRSSPMALAATMQAPKKKGRAAVAGVALAAIVAAGIGLVVRDRGHGGDPHPVVAGSATSTTSTATTPEPPAGAAVPLAAPEGLADRDAGAATTAPTGEPAATATAATAAAKGKAPATNRAPAGGPAATPKAAPAKPHGTNYNL